MGVKRLLSSSTDPSPNDTVKSDQSNGATAAALTGIVTGIGAGVTAIVKSANVSNNTTAPQAAVILGALFLAAVGVIATAWVLTTDFKNRVTATTAVANASTD